MRIDWGGVGVFRDYLAGRAAGSEVLAHPAYAPVREHARLAYGHELTPADLDRAVEGEESPMFGLRAVRQNLPRIDEFVAYGRKAAPRWLDQAERSLARLAPADGAQAAELADVTVYPIIGYDAGIGLAGAACLNVNWATYLDEPEEFGYVMIHELCHVLYQAAGRPFPGIAATQQPDDWHRLFCRMTQDEGFATWAPLAARRAAGHLGDDSNPISCDYAVLRRPAVLAEHLAAWRETERKLRAGGKPPAEQKLPAGDAPGDGPVRRREDYIELVFGPRRLTYRAGAALVRSVEAQGGQAAVRRLFAAPAVEFCTPLIAGSNLVESSLGDPAQEH